MFSGEIMRKLIVKANEKGQRIDKYIRKYLDTIKEEILERYQNEEVVSIYIGGGTPTSLDEEELKYFYANYKDYYYLPTEDVALHKSVASFVDKEHRVQAVASTCYTRKVSLYLPQWEVLFKPFFKREYKSKELFFELTDELKKDRQAFTDYAKHVLEMMGSTY